jgi:hypothetical protein
MPLGLDGWLARIEALHPRGSAGIELGLERVAAVKARLGQREFCPVFLVGGTNGKGSTCAMLERILLRRRLPRRALHLAPPAALQRARPHRRRGGVGRRACAALSNASRVRAVTLP